MAKRTDKEIHGKLLEWDAHWSGLPGGDSSDDFGQGVITALAWVLGEDWDGDYDARLIDFPLVSVENEVTDE
jgi:hypothetical protein